MPRPSTRTWSRSLRKVLAVHIGDLQFSPRTWLEIVADLDNAGIIDVEAGHREMALRDFWLFFQADRLAIRPKLDDPVSLRIAHLIAKDARPALGGDHVERLSKEVEFAVENVVPQNQRDAIAADEFLSDEEGMRDARGLLLRGIFDAHAERGTIAEKMLESAANPWEWK